jgi:hypothetical protein
VTLRYDYTSVAAVHIGKGASRKYELFIDGQTVYRCTDCLYMDRLFIDGRTVYIWTDCL